MHLNLHIHAGGTPLYLPPDHETIDPAKVDWSRVRRRPRSFTRTGQRNWQWAQERARRSRA